MTIEYSVRCARPETVETPCLIVGVGKGNLGPTANALDKASQGLISERIKAGDISGKIGQTLLLTNLNDIKANRILLVGTGDPSKLTERHFTKIMQATSRTLLNLDIPLASCSLIELAIKNRKLKQKLQKAVKILANGHYRFDQMKSKKNNEVSSLSQIEFIMPNKTDLSQATIAIQQASAVEHGVKLARDLSNLPANVCTPTYLAEQAKQLAKKFRSIKTKILDEKQMAKLGMNSLLSVSQGSTEPAKFIIMDYQGNDPKQKPIVLIGKGITFDSGGISLKPSAGMDEMKFDMCGAASVLGALQAIAELKLSPRVIGIIASSENLPGNHATKPGDIITSMAGKTIEVLNTDAEGRLVLCDALSYAEKFEPTTVIDIATLTGAIIVALGHHISGMMSNHPPLAEALTRAGETSGDRVWELPIDDEYQELLDSNFADIANIGGRAAGSITAACFLARFSKNFHWAHLDIAGTAWKSGKEKGATGRPVALLTQYIVDQSAKV